MAHGSANEKQQAHELIERLAPNQVTAVVGLIEAMLDPVSRAIANAPIDDEPLSPEEEKAVDEAKEWLRHHPGIPFEEVLAEFGLTVEDLKAHPESK